MKYPARIGSNTRGSIILDKNVVSAKYLLSYNADGQKLFKISNEQFAVSLVELVKRKTLDKI